MALAPWMQQPNFVGAMAAGASAGAALRGQDIAESEAGDRLTLAYQQLAAEERQRTEMAKQRMQAATAAMQLKQQQLSLLDQYRTSRLAADAAKLKQQKELAQMPKLHFGTAGEVLSEQAGAVTQLRPARAGAVRPGAFDLADYNDVRREMNSIAKQIEAGTALPAEIPRLRQRLNDLNAVAQGIKVKAQSATLPTPEAIPKVTTKDQHAALPPGSTYIGADGKTYRKKGAAVVTPPPFTEDQDAANQ